MGGGELQAAADPGDVSYVARCLGREPRCPFDVVARDPAGRPVVIRNRPVLDDGTPMPTLYWLVDPALSRRVGTLEAGGGVHRAEAVIDPSAVADCHRRYAAERDAWLPEVHHAHLPAGGVGGTRVGVKCLHAHLAWHLAGGDDPVGRWVAAELEHSAEVAP